MINHLQNYQNNSTNYKNININSKIFKSEQIAIIKIIHGMHYLDLYLNNLIIL